MITLLFIILQQFSAWDFTQLESLLEDEQWGQALQVIRVNDGLYSELQVPVLKKLDMPYTILGIMDHNYGPGSAESLEALQAIEFTSVNDLQTLDRQGDTDEIHNQLLLMQITLLKNIYKQYEEMGLSEYRGTLSSTVYNMAAQKEIELNRIAAMINRRIKELRQ